MTFYVLTIIFYSSNIPYQQYYESLQQCENALIIETDNGKRKYIKIAECTKKEIPLI